MRCVSGLPCYQAYVNEKGKSEGWDKSDDGYDKYCRICACIHDEEVVIKCEETCAHPCCGDPGSTCQIVICRSCIATFYPEEEPRLFVDEDVVPGGAVP